jgi:hypothetical protein
MLPKRNSDHRAGLNFGGTISGGGFSANMSAKVRNSEKSTRSAMSRKRVWLWIVMIGGDWLNG